MERAVSSVVERHVDRTTTCQQSRVRTEGSQRYSDLFITRVSERSSSPTFRLEVTGDIPKRIYDEPVWFSLQQEKCFCTGTSPGTFNKFYYQLLCLYRYHSEECKRSKTSLPTVSPLLVGSR